MENIVCDFITKNSIFKHGDRIVVGLSGGADSVALLRVLVNLSDSLRLKLFAAHVNHNMRGESSDDDEKFCVELCKTLNIPLKIYSVDMAGYASEMKLSSEEAGRELRYESFSDALNFFSAGVIATAHNKNDQAETFLMRVLRGTGIKGLCAIRALSGNLARPLLCVSRREIEDYLETLGQPYKTDETNASDAYTRNKIRSKLLPLMINEFNPSAIDTICRSSEILSEESDFIEREAEHAYGLCAVGNSLEIAKLKTLHSAILKRVVRLAYKKASGTLRDLSAAQTDCVLSLLDSESGASAELVNNYKAVIEYGFLKFVKRVTNLPFCYELTAEKQVYVKEIDRYVVLSRKINDGGVAFDFDKLKGSVFVRSRRNGDKIKIDGLGTKKLSDFFTDRKTPRDERDSVPILEVNGEIVFVAGGNGRNAYVDGRFAANSSSKNAIHFLLWGGSNIETEH